MQSNFGLLESSYIGKLPEGGSTLDLELLKQSHPYKRAPCFFIPQVGLTLRQQKEVTKVTFADNEKVNLYAATQEGFLLKIDLNSKKINNRFFVKPEKEFFSSDSNEIIQCITAGGNFSSLLSVGTNDGSVYFYDSRSSGRSKPALLYENVHIGSVCNIRHGIENNSHLFLTGGVYDSWIRIFDIRFPTLIKTNRNLGQSLRSIKVIASILGILDLDVSHDGSLLAVSNHDGELVFYSINQYFKHMKTFAIGDSSTFYSLKFTFNGKYVIACAESKSKVKFERPYFSSHLINTIQTNRSICLKTPADGISVYSDHFVLEYQNEKDQLGRPHFLLRSPSSLYLKELRHKFWKESILSSPQINCLELHETCSKEKKPMLDETSTAQLAETSTTHEKNFNQFRAVSSDMNPLKYNYFPHQLLSRLNPQTSVFYSSCGPMHPSFGRFDCFDQRFQCCDLGGIVVGIGGSSFYPGLHTWDGVTGACLSSSIFPEVSLSCIKALAPEPTSKILISAGHKKKGNFLQGAITIWRMTSREALIQANMDGYCELTLDD